MKLSKNICMMKLFGFEESQIEFHWEIVNEILDYNYVLLAVHDYDWNS